MTEDLVRRRALRMGPYGLQGGIAQRNAGCRLLSAPRSALLPLLSLLPASRRRGPRRPPPTPTFGSVSAAESRQHALCDFQFIELLGQLCPFSLDPRQPLGNTLLLLPDFIQRRHLLSSSSSPNNTQHSLAVDILR